MSVPNFIAVVHLTTPDQAATESSLALEAGAGGVFLINHFGPPTELRDALNATRRAVGDAAWIGVNPLGLSAISAATFVRDLDLRVARVDGLWCDNADIDEHRGPEDQPAAEAALEARGNWAGSYFGGVAFKHQRHVDDLSAAIDCAVPWMDVVCTSGPATGQAADPNKPAEMHAQLAGRKPLAIASGITQDNVHDFLFCVDIFVVATGISVDPTRLDSPLDPAKVASLARLIETGKADANR